MRAFARVNVKPEKIAFISLLLFAATGLISITLVQASYACAAACWVIWIIGNKGKKGWVDNPLILPILAFVAANLLAYFFSIDPTASLKGLRQLALIGLVFVVGNCIQDESKIKSLIFTWLFFAAIVCTYSVCQYFYGISRVRGFFGGPMTLSRILIMVNAVALVLFLYVKNRGRYFCLTAAIIGIVALYFTFTRGAWIALGVALTFLAIVKRNKIFLALITAAVCLALLLGIFFPHTNTGNVIFSIIRPFDHTSQRYYHSNLQRIWKYKCAFLIFADHPLTGVGQRNFGKVYPHYLPPEIKDDNWPPPKGKIYTGFAHAHNTYLNILATQGIFGIVAFLWLVITLIKLTYNNYLSFRDPFPKNLSLGILTAIVAFLVLGLFNENSRDSESIIQLWFLAGIAVALARLYTEKQGRQNAVAPDIHGNERLN